MINEQNKNTWCVNAFHGMSANNDGTTKLCCMYRPTDFNQVLGVDSIDEHFNKREFIKVREELNNGIRHKNCQLCWDEEDSGRTSKRLRDNKKYQTYILKNEPYNGLSYLELNLGNNCNLSCRTCGPQISSGWMKEDFKTNYNTSKFKLSTITYKEYSEKFKKFYKSYSEDSIFWEDLTTHLPNIKQFDFYGGEPFMSKKMWEILRIADQMGVSKNIELHYNTNGTHLPLELLSVWKNFKKVYLSFSIDGIGDTFEYMRYPAKWDHVLNNMNEFVKIGDQYGNIHMSWCITISVANVYSVPETVEFYQKNFADKMGMYLNLVHGPVHHNISILPDSVKNIVKDRLESIPKEYTIAWQHIPGIVSFMNLKNYNQEKLKEFFETTTKSDVHRSQDFYTTFKEYAHNFKNV
jgi:MoaA/NifB/PqqE/SkfB family radical SAM enzyme